MKKIIFGALLILLIVMILPLHSFAQEIPSLPAYCYGELKINGQPAPIGTVVVAKVDGVERGRLDTFYVGWHGRPGLGSKLLVSGSGLGGKMVRFFVSGQGFSDLFAGEVLYWGSGQGLRIDLAVQVDSVPDPLNYTLNVSVVGQGTTSPVVGIHSYSSGTQVTLQATAQSGWVFEKWVIGSSTVTTATTTAVMNANRTATAYFVQPGDDSTNGGGSSDPLNYTLNVSVVGQGTTSPVVGEHSYSSGTQVTLQATAQSGWVFEKWVIGSSTVTTATTTVMMNANRTATAHFVQADDNSTNGGDSSAPPAPPAGEDGIRPGDINGSGTIDVNDVVLVLQSVLEMRTLTENQKKAADVNKDGKIDVRDVTLIMKFALGLITSF